MAFFLLMTTLTGILNTAPPGSQQWDCGHSRGPIAGPTNSTGKYPAGTSPRGLTGSVWHMFSPLLGCGTGQGMTAPTALNQTTQTVEIS